VKQKSNSFMQAVHWVSSHSVGSIHSDQIKYQFLAYNSVISIY